MIDPVLDVTGVTKQYGALRPLRLQRLTVSSSDQIALIGLDQPAAEVFINLVTGASLPEHGDIVVFGRSTAQIADTTDWLTTLDRFGIVSERAALLEPLSVIQNLSVPFTLDIEPPPPDVRARADALAREVGIPVPQWDRAVGELTPVARLQLRLARALALDPSIVILEHPSATLGRPEVKPIARAIKAILGRRAIASLTLTMDQEFAATAASRVLTLEPATGKFSEKRTSRMRLWS